MLLDGGIGSMLLRLDISRLKYKETSERGRVFVEGANSREDLLLFDGRSRSRHVCRRSRSRSGLKMGLKELFRVAHTSHHKIAPYHCCYSTHLPVIVRNDTKDSFLC